MSAEAAENNGNGNGIKLYYWYTSFYSQRVLMTLYEKNVKFRTQVVSLFALEQYESWFLRLNPRGEVPVLTDGVKVIPDSSRIIEYLEDNFSNGKYRPLTPKDKGSEESKKIEKYRTLLETVPVPSITYGSAANPEFLENPKPPFTSAILARMKEVAKSRHLLLREQAKKNPEFSETLLAKAEEAEKGALNLNKSKEEMELVYMNVDGTFDIIEEELASHGEEHCDWWLCGEMFSIADIDLAVLLNRLYQLGFEGRFWEGKRPSVEAYWKRIQERESFKKATQVSPSVFKLTIFRSILQQNRTYLVTLATALGIAVTSFLVYKRIQHT